MYGIYGNFIFHMSRQIVELRFSKPSIQHSRIGMMCRRIDVWKSNKTSPVDVAAFKWPLLRHLFAHLNGN